MFALAGIAKAVSDKIQFHFERSIFADQESYFWNPAESWRNKWKNGNRSEGEAFLGSSTIFVWVTDAWHLFNTFRIIMYVAAVFAALLIDIKPDWMLTGFMLCIWIIRSSAFHFCFTYLFDKEFYKS